MRCLGFLIVFGLICSPLTETRAEALSFEQRRALFNYDKSDPLEIITKASFQEGAVKISDVIFSGKKNKPVSAFIVEPQQNGLHSAVIFVHWGFGTRTQFLEEATRLAKQGTVSALLSVPFLGSRKHFIRSVTNIQRITDILLTRHDIDPSRMAYVGHSWGATLGAILSGLETRFRTMVLMAGTPQFSRKAPGGDMEDIDGVAFLNQASRGNYLLQFAEADQFVSTQEAELFVHSLNAPKQVRWYPGGHGLEQQAATDDRLAWLSSQLAKP